MLEPGLAEQAVEFVRRNIETVALEDGVRRQERWDYPEEVIREAVVNAIVHRDYLLSGSDIELSIYSDRLDGVRRVAPYSFGGASVGMSSLPNVRSRCVRMACFRLSMNMLDGSSRSQSVSVAT